MYCQEKSSSGNEVFSKMSMLNIHPHSVSVKVFGELINQWFQQALVNWQQFCSLALWKIHIVLSHLHHCHRRRRRRHHQKCLNGKVFADKTKKSTGFFLFQFKL